MGLNPSLYRKNSPTYINMELLSLQDKKNKIIPKNYSLQVFLLHFGNPYNFFEASHFMSDFNQAYKGT